MLWYFVSRQRLPLWLEGTSQQAQPFNGHIKTAGYSSMVIGTLAVDGWASCYIRHSEEGTGRGRRAAAPPSPLLVVPNVTAHPSTASVPTSCHSMWHYNYLDTLKPGTQWRQSCNTVDFVENRQSGPCRFGSVYTLATVDFVADLSPVSATVDLSPMCTRLKGLSELPWLRQCSLRHVSR